MTDVNLHTQHQLVSGAERDRREVAVGHTSPGDDRGRCPLGSRCRPTAACASTGAAPHR